MSINSQHSHRGGMMGAQARERGLAGYQQHLPHPAVKWDLGQISEEMKDMWVLGPSSTGLP